MIEFPLAKSDKDWLVNRNQNKSNQIMREWKKEKEKEMSTQIYDIDIGQNDVLSYHTQKKTKIREKLRIRNPHYDKKYSHWIIRK